MVSHGQVGGGWALGPGPVQRAWGSAPLQCDFLSFTKPTQILFYLFSEMLFKVHTMV